MSGGESKISKKDVEHLKKLARLEFEEKETEKLTEDLEKILNYMNVLNEVDFESVSQIPHSFFLKNVFRKDENPKEFDEKLTANLISSFPEKKETYLKVKVVLKK